MRHSALTYFAFLGLLFFISCTSPIVFDQAYPLDAEAAEEIAVHYQGIYMCESDSTIIVITSQEVYAQSPYYFEMSIQDAEDRENCILNDGELYLTEVDECIDIEYIGEDSIKGEYYELDTLFNISDDAIVKPYKGSLVLSQKLKDNEWVINLLSLDGYGNVIYRSITDESELDKVEAITEMEQVGVDRNSEPIYKVSPSKHEFDQLFENPKIFIECEYLISVNLENFTLPQVF